MELEHLWKLYLPLVSWVSLGLVLGYKLPPFVPLALGKFLFWIGVPLSTLSFLRQVDLSASVWIAPIAAWISMLLGAWLAWLWIQAQIRGFAWPMLRVWSTERLQQTSSQGSFLLASMLGNTGYLGYPIALVLVGTQYFGWTVFYDTLGTTLGAYGFGVVLAAHFGNTAANSRQLLLALIQNPTLWSFWIALGSRSVPLPQPIEQGLAGLAWAMVALSLLLMGMRLSQLRFWEHFPQAAVSLSMNNPTAASCGVSRREEITSTVWL